MQVEEPEVNRSNQCIAPAIDEFPSDGFTAEQRRSGFIVIHIVLAIYLFLLLAVVCDDFFVPSITKICESKYFFIFFSSKINSGTDIIYGNNLFLLILIIYAIYICTVVAPFT